MKDTGLANAPTSRNWQRLRLRRRALFRSFPRWFWPRFSAWLHGLATWEARRRLRRADPLLVLVDNSVLGFAVTHETKWISTGRSLWGGVHPIDTGYQARVPVHAPDSRAPEYEHLRYLMGLTELGRRGHIAFKTSGELKDEQFDQPSGRYTGYGYYDYSLFRGVKMEWLDGIASFSLGPRSLNLPSLKEQRVTRLKASTDPLCLALVNELGQKHSQDAWHIRTAEAHGLFCFLTMDFKLHRLVRQRQHREPFRSLKTRVMTPAELGKELQVSPLHPILLSYDDASFPVHTDVTMPGGKRRPVRAYRSKSN